MEKMKIDIWSDIACPYCYIGKRKLEKASENFPHKDKVELVWHSYELDPSLPKEALESKIYGYFADKYKVTEADARRIIQKTADRAKEVGLIFDFDNQIIANTFDALRLVKLANKSGLATEAEEALFSAYFCEGKDVSDKATLISIGETLGLKPSDVEKMLNGDDYIKEVKDDIGYSESKLSLQYIPLYVFNNKHTIQGAIASEEYLNVLEKAYAEWEKEGISSETGDAISGQSCSLDGVCS